MMAPPFARPVPARWLAVLGLLLVALLGGCSRSSSRASGADAGAPVPLILATTTSTQDTGLLDVLLPRFQQGRAIVVKVVAVGTGEALAMGGRGDADVLLVHAPAKEAEFMARGDGSLRLPVMHNDFLLVGPNDDPAGVKGQEILAALRQLAEAGAPFASRGDRSGTHSKELELWKAAGADPPPSHRLETGQGMAETLRVCSEKRAYTLADRGTYLALRKTLDLVPISEGALALRNPYAVIVVSSSKFPKVHAREAESFARWLVSPEAQKLIAEFGVDRFGQPLFVADATGEQAP